MKRLFCLLFICLFLWGCNAQVTELSHKMPHSQGVSETAPSVEPLPDIPVNPYGPIDFGYEGDYMACFGGEYILGMDISHHQTEVNWQQVKAAGIDYVMIRVGQRGSEQGLLMEDRLFREHYAGAKAAGIKIGCYFFSQAITPEEATEEANYLLELTRDWELDMPIAYDWEFMPGDNNRTGEMDRQTLTDCTVAFCETIKTAGHKPMVYFNQEQARTMLILEKLLDYEFWLAMYTDSMSYNYQVNMWQYTQTGSVPGITGDVDLNLYLIYS